MLETLLPKRECHTIGVQFLMVFSFDRQCKENSLFSNLTVNFDVISWSNTLNIDSLSYIPFLIKIVIMCGGKELIGFIKEILDI